MKTEDYIKGKKRIARDILSCYYCGDFIDIGDEYYLRMNGKTVCKGCNKE